MTSPSNSYELLSSTRRDSQLLAVAWNTAANANKPSPYLLLIYHHDRLRDAARLHNWPIPDNLTLSGLQDLCDAAVVKAGAASGGSASEDHWRIRILLSPAGALSVTATPVPPLPNPDLMAPSLWFPSASSLSPPSFGLDLLVIHLDTVPTPSSVFTRTKTTSRDHYNAARSRFNIPPPPTPSLHDVLLFNKDGDITETSIRNIAFLRRSPPQWVTPAASTGCLPGVGRRWALEHSRVVEAANRELTKDNLIDGEYVLTFNGVEGCRVGRIIVKSA